MASAGYVFKAVTSQLSKMDEMDVPDKEWNIFDEDFLSTPEVIEVLFAAGIPSMENLATKLQNIVDCENENNEES